MVRLKERVGVRDIQPTRLGVGRGNPYFELTAYKDSPLFATYSREQCLAFLPPETEAIESMASISIGKEVHIDTFILNAKLRYQWNRMHELSQLIHNQGLAAQRMRMLDHTSSIALFNNLEEQFKEIDYQNFLHYLSFLQHRGSDFGDTMSDYGVHIAVFSEGLDFAHALLQHNRAISLRGYQDVFKTPQSAFDLSQLAVTVPLTIPGYGHNENRYINLSRTSDGHVYGNPVGVGSIELGSSSLVSFFRP